MDLRIPFPNASDNDLAAQFFGGTRGEVPEVCRDGAPLARVDAETVPFLILQGAAGDLAVEHSQRMTTALHETGVEVIYGEFPGQGHLATADWGLAGPFTLAFLARHLDPGN